MRGWLGRAIKYTFLKKIALVFLLAIMSFLLSKTNFPRLESLMRDGLQFLNDQEEVASALTTITINNNTDRITYPYSFPSLKKIIDALQEKDPRYIILCIEPLDLIETEGERDKIYEYFLSQKNLYLIGSISRNDVTDFNHDPLFKDFPRMIEFDLAKDNTNDGKNRRAIINIERKGYSPLFKILEDMKLNPKTPDFFLHLREFWESSQAYIKNYPLESYGNYQTSNLLIGNLSKSAFENKLVFVGTHDEFSFLALPSIFNILGNTHPSDVKSFITPFQHIVANIFNFHITGNYIKYVQNFNDIYFVFAILCVLIFINIAPIKKVSIFLAITPLIIIFEISIYMLNSYYFDFSRSIALLALIQYLAIPAVMLSLFKANEQQKLKSINDARIDSFLSISERVAHDIRSPLSSISLLLSKANFDNPEYKEIIKTSLNRISEISEDILHKYSIKTDPEKAAPAPFEIEPVVKKVIRERTSLSSHINYKTTFNLNPGMTALGHKTELERALNNILDNAIYALRETERPEVHFILTNDSDGITVQIQDNGPGIPSYILSLIGKSRVTTKEPFKGSGIGLLHSKRAVEQMGGTFDVFSSETGTIIKLTLKIASTKLVAT